MIPYKKLGWGMHLLLRFYGSAVMKTFVFGALAALQTALLYAFISEEQRQSYYTSSFPGLTFPAFAGMVAFLVIFRQNFSYGRYHEGRVHLQGMTASFFTLYSLAVSFDKQPSESAKAKAASNDKDALRKRREDEEEFRNDLTHGVSLMHALCMQHLRCDWELSNLSAHDEDFLPPWDLASTPGYKVPLWRYFFPYYSTTSRMKWNRASKIQVIGGLTSAERAGLNDMGLQRMLTTRHGSEASPDGSSNLADPDSKPARRPGCLAGLWTSETSTIVRGANDRPYKVIYATMELIRNRFECDGLSMPPPIIATIWQNFSAGIAHFEHCVYLKDTPFPFPWAQLIVMVLIMWQIIVPFTVFTVKSEAMAITLAVVSTWILWALNEVAREIESPYVHEPNDLPLSRLQYQFNEMLLAVAAGAGANNGDALGWKMPATKWYPAQPAGQSSNGGASRPTLANNVSKNYHGSLATDIEQGVGMLGV